MSKHTPGPWRDNGDPTMDDPSEEYHEIVGGRGCYPDGFALTGYISTANARLIAAAPELLEALRGLTAKINTLWDKGITTGMNANDLRDARDAIAKATNGRS